MTKTLLSPLLLTFFAVFHLGSLSAQSLDFRRYAGGLIGVQNQSGLDLLFRPNEIAEVPDALSTKTMFVLGQAFDKMTLRRDGTPHSAPVMPDGNLADDAISIESAKIGSRRAAIRIESHESTVLLVSVDIMSDQGFISTGKDRKVHLTILTFDDATKLYNARTNLWLSVMESQQIAVNPTSNFPDASVEKFYQSLKRNRTLPTGVLPMMTVPNGQLEFGDRQVVLLKEAQ